MTADLRAWDRRIARAGALAPDGNPILRFALEILQFQRELSARSAGDPSAETEPAMLELAGRVARVGPEPLVAVARDLAEADAGSLMAAYLADALPVHDPRRFFPKVVAQAQAGRWSVPPGSRDGPGTRCPRCGGPPQVGVLEPVGEGARRSLVCARCLLTWPFRRIACAACGEADSQHLAVHVAEGWPHLRVSTCATCRVYLKEADASVDGRVEPLVDDLASPVLDLWAQQHDFLRDEPNLAGL